MTEHSSFSGSHRAFPSPLSWQARSCVNTWVAESVPRAFGSCVPGCLAKRPSLGSLDIRCWVFDWSLGHGTKGCCGELIELELGFVSATSGRHP
ncbi:hypothetical protein L3X38_023621 [Prunus dulcis]|uniref:Uncharacterized protein n=1 Tax=Prunus dulcis TaxID=3755 RepID=A0AAD4Z5E8_PRUDU|nr:hypothetical protein L3X38_023621 [Prunus dulcis]